MSGFVVDYGPDVESAIDRLVDQIEQAPEVNARYVPRWLAAALLDEDPGPKTPKPQDLEMFRLFIYFRILIKKDEIAIIQCCSPFLDGLFECHSTRKAS